MPPLPAHGLVWSRWHIYRPVPVVIPGVILCDAFLEWATVARMFGVQAR